MGHRLKQPFGLRLRGGRARRVRGLRYVQQVRSSSGFVPFSAALAPFRAVGEHKGQLAWLLLFSFHLPLGSTGFHRFHRYYEEIRLLLGAWRRCRCLLQHFHFRGPEKISLGKGEWLPAAPVLNTVTPRLDIGRRVDEHACPDMPALRGFAFARCCGSSSASIPHALTGKVGSGSRRFRPRAAAYDSWLPPVGPIRDFHPPPFIHARRTQSPYGLLPIPPRSLSSKILMR